MAAGVVVLGLSATAEDPVPSSGPLPPDTTGGFHEGFEGRDPTARVRYSRSAARLSDHVRRAGGAWRGRSSEQIVLDIKRDGQRVRIEHSLPPARIIDEMTVGLAVRANRAGLRLGVEVVFPRQRDPRTGQVLRHVVPAERYTRAGTWQQLSCRGLRKRIRERLPLLRSQLQTGHLDLREMYADAVVLTAKPMRGRFEVSLDELVARPIISPSAGLVERVGRRSLAAEAPPVELRLDRLLVEGYAFLPRIVPYHGEDAGLLRDSGVNLVWTQDHQDRQLLEQMRTHGLWVMASPPRPMISGGVLAEERQASLLPFTGAVRPVLCWYLGTRIPASRAGDLAAWTAQVRTADRNVRRPILADVIGIENSVSRRGVLPAMSRHVIHTSYPIGRYRDWLIERRRLTRPGSFAWTWVQTEAAPANLAARRAAGLTPAVVEPEQIELQVRAALAAGYRGIGFWKRTRLDDTSPGARERRLALTGINLELELLEPWYATATLLGEVPVEFDRVNGSSESTVRGALFGTEHGQLLLPVWEGRYAGFVPGQLAANDATIVIRGANETASAWQVTTTDVRRLNRTDCRRVAGGLQVRLRRLERHGVVILTPDRRLIDMLRRKVASLAPAAARVALELAQAKLERVRRVDRELDEMGVGQPDAARLLAGCVTRLERSASELERGRFDESRRLSDTGLQLLRILQRAHWENAVKKLASPLSSPHTICFQTLPDHWRLVHRVRRMRASGNLLPAAGFEDAEAMLAAGWRHRQRHQEGVRIATELYPLPKSGYCLRLLAASDRGGEAADPLPERPLRVSTPGIAVAAGDLVRIRGRLRVVSSITHSLDGVSLWDSLGGRVAALRWHTADGWQDFELLREVHEDAILKLYVALEGLGDVRLDDLEIVRLIDETRPKLDSASISPRLGR